MRKLVLLILFVPGFAAAGGVSGAVVAATTSTATTTTTTTAPTAVPTPTASPSPRRPPRRPARPAVIAAGVTVGRVAVGGLSPDSAEGRVLAAFARPLVLVLVRRWFRVSPARLGAVAYVRGAVARARAAAPGETVPLKVAVRGRRTRAFVASLARRFDRTPVDSRLVLRGVRPFLTRHRPGRRLDRPRAVGMIVRALVANLRRPLRLMVKRVAPAATRGSYGAVIVIRRESKRLDLYDGMRPWRTFGVATGQPSYPTPLGRFSIAVMWRHPWWYPPDSPWAAGARPIPPGPGNPLGTRWMGLTAPGVGIHGTPDPASIGYSASHGCIRMRISEAEWLFDRVRVGTTVFIVAA